MNTQLENAQELLFGASGLRVANFKLFPGNSREVTAEDVVCEIATSIDSLLKEKPHQLDLKSLKE